jgi:hypothetical protein
MRELTKGMIEIADTLELKFRPMFKELPGTIVGLYGENFGFSKEVVVQFAKALEDEYDSLSDEERSKIDRVANYFLNPSSPLRAQISTLHELRSSLNAFPRLRREVQEYAFALLVAHRLEGVHRQIKCFIARGTIVTPGLACARVRGGEMSRLMDCPHFVKFASRNWNSMCNKSVLNNLLMGTRKVSKVQVFRMSLKQKAAKLYQYDEASQFEDSAAAAQAIHEFKVETERSLTVAVEARTVAENAIVNFYRAGFDEGGIYSLPSHFLTTVQGRTPLPIDDIPKLLKDALDAPIAGVGHGNQTTFFEVISCNPHAKTTVRASHAQKRLTHIRCQVLELVAMDDTSPVLRPRPDLSFELNLMNWASKELGTQVAASLRVWDTCSYRLQPEPISGQSISFSNAILDGMQEAPVDLDQHRTLLDLLDSTLTSDGVVDALVPLEAGQVALLGQSLVPFLGRDEVGQSALSFFWERGILTTRPVDDWCDSNLRPHTQNEL